MGNVEREFFVSQPPSPPSLTKIWAVGCGLWAGLGLFSPWVGLWDDLWDAHGERVDRLYLSRAWRTVGL